MNVTFYGHNCFFLKGNKINIVCDPWLSNKGAFFGSWFQWPINHSYIDQLINQLKNETNNYLYISHEHQDHFDKETLAILKPFFTACIIPKYEDPFLYNAIDALGYEVNELNDQSKYYFNETDFIEFMIIDTGVYHDSAAIINLDEETFVNQNDCKIFDRLSYLENMDIKYYAVQFSGASWHPVCYQMDESEKTQISKKKVLSKLIAVRNAIKLVNPEYYIPSAGPAIFPFLDDNLSLGNGNIFVHQPDLKNFLKNINSKLIYIRPGECLDVNKVTDPIEPPSISDLNSLRNSLDCEFYKNQSNEFNIDNLYNEVQSRLNQIKGIKFAECPKLILDWKDEGLEIDLNSKNAKRINFSNYQLPNNFMRIKASKTYFGLMGNSDYRWQDIYLSLRAKVERKPDTFNTFVNAFLFSDTSNIRSGFTTTLDINDERIVIVNPLDGKNYEINRYCPHNGADLKNAKIDDKGNLICPRHSWLFDLKNNGICKNTNVTIEANEVIDTISLCETISTRLIKEN
tara:strand:- start:634 stop:2178 length:1545 start_codon:yes stop_codon:yes gene_type:complete